MRFDPESWEDHVDLHDRRDYPALVDLCESEVATSPSDLHAIERLGNAYVLNGDFDAAIKLVAPIHEQYPNLDFSHIILDALFAKGQTEADFDWVIPPVIFRCDSVAADACYDYLRSKRKPRSIPEINCELVMTAYLTFTEDELFTLLSSDERFQVGGDNALDAKVTINRARRRITTS